MNNKVKQTSLNLYNKVYTDNSGAPAYPWRVSAGHKFEAMGAMAFFQSKMNNHHIVREFYKSSPHHPQIHVKMIHGDDSTCDLKYKINFNDRSGVLYRHTKTLMHVEFKLITCEALNKYGFEGAISNLFQYFGSPNRAYKFLEDKDKEKRKLNQRLNLLVIGMTNVPSHEIVPLSHADAFRPIMCIGYMHMPASPSSHKKLITKKVVRIFESFSEYAYCIHSAVSPRQLFNAFEQDTHVDHTMKFIRQFGLP